MRKAREEFALEGWCVVWFIPSSPEHPRIATGLANQHEAQEKAQDILARGDRIIAVIPCKKLENLQ